MSSRCESCGSTDLAHPENTLCDTCWGDGPEFCGCCGNELDECSDERLWCYVCAEHVLSYGPIGDRTFFARYGEDCPFQMSGRDMTNEKGTE